MADVKFMMWNVRGMRDKIKRTAVLQYLKGQKVDIIALVEMHVTGHLQAVLKRPWVGWAYHSTHTNMSRGIAVLVAKSTPFELISMVLDQQGRYLFLHALVGGDPLLILASYIPPPYRSDVVAEGLAFIALYPSVPVVWMGILITQ